MTAFRTPAEAWEYRNFGGGIQPQYKESATPLMFDGVHIIQ
jgi:hypothetical protein